MEFLEFNTITDHLGYLNTTYIFIPAAVVEEIGGLTATRLKCTVNNKVTFQCGLMSLSEGAAYISINKKRMKEAGITTGDPVHIHLEPDNSKYGLEVPPELAEVFRQDPEGFDRFEKLPKGKQRYVIFHVGAVKNPQLRIDRSLMLINNLKTLTPGKETFRGMLGLPG